MASGATLALNGFSQVIGSLAGVAGASVTLGSGTLTTGGDNTHTIYAGALPGPGGLVKEGSDCSTSPARTPIRAAPRSTAGSADLTGGNAIGDPSAVKVNSGAVLLFQNSETIGSLADGASGGGQVRLTASVRRR